MEEVLSQNMSSMTLLWLGIVVILAVLIVALISARRRSGLRRLSPEAGARYATEWRRIEAAFIDEPAEAVKRADDLAVAMLSERGARLEDERKVPESLRAAREATSEHWGSGQTEGFRVAMLRYQGIVDEAVGEGTRKEAQTGRREVAS